MNITSEDAAELQRLAREIAERVTEFKHICRKAMSQNEYQRFKYRTLGHLEPAVIEGSEWMGVGSMDSLEKVADKAVDEAIAEDETTEEPA